ncbi:MAG: M36 family metallopeptidase, partial [Acidobacteriota bacterium]
WCSALWEIRARMIARLGWRGGNRQAMQLVMDGMKLAPLSPTFLSERDAIIAAGVAGGTPEDVADMWAGFATRGIGASASIQNVGGISIGGTGTTRVTQAFDLPNLSQTQDLIVDDSLGDNDGIAEPGERVGITIPLTNSTGVTATGVTLQIVGGGSVTYGSIGGASTVSQKAGYIIPLGTPCGSLITLTLNVNSSLGPVSFTRTISVGQSITTLAENFDAVTPPAIAAGWTVTSSYAPMTFVSNAAGPDTAPNSMFAADLPNCTTGCSPTNGGSTELTSPVIAISGAAATVSFRHSYNSEPGFDGGALEISIAGGAFQDFVAAGGKFLQNGYTATLGVSSPNPLGGRGAWTGNSLGYLTTIARLPAAASGQNVQLRWRFGADSNGAPTGGGWNVDSIQVAGNFGCAFTPAATVSVSGRVSTPDGRGLRNARVLLIDPLNLPQEVTTSAAGLYQFDSVQPGITYTIRVVSKLYRFNQQNVNVNGNLTNINFVGQE